MRSNRSTSSPPSCAPRSGPPSTTARRRGTRSAPSSCSTTYADPDRLRTLAGKIKQHVVENLDTYLPAVEARMRANGVQVHWAGTAESACQTVLGIMRARGATRMVKAKTMVSEEIGLAAFLERNGIEALETDLGEFIVQIDRDHPSHIVDPIIHKNRREIARSFEEHGLGAYDDEPEVITRRARQFLRKKYLAADVGADGRQFRRRRERAARRGHQRGQLALLPGRHPVPHRPRRHREDPAARPRPGALPQPARPLRHRRRRSRSTPSSSAGPKSPAQPDGPEEMHVIFVDNGRTEVLAERVPGDPAVHPLRGLPERLPGLPPGERPCLPQRLSRAGRGGAVAAAAGRALPGEGRPAQGIEPLRRLQRGLPGQYPDPRPAPAPARPGQAGGRRTRPARRRWAGWALLASQPAAWKAALVGRQAPRTTCRPG